MFSQLFFVAERVSSEVPATGREGVCYLVTRVLYGYVLNRGLLNKAAVVCQTPATALLSRAVTALLRVPVVLRDLCRLIGGHRLKKTLLVRGLLR